MKKFIAFAIVAIFLIMLLSNDKKPFTVFAKDNMWMLIATILASMFLINKFYKTKKTGGNEFVEDIDGACDCDD